MPVKTPAKKAARKPAKGDAKTGTKIMPPDTAGATGTVDFSSPLSAEDLEAARNQSRSPWVAKLLALAEGVKAGRGDMDTFYRLRTFADSNGARTAIRNIRRREDAEFLAGFRLEPRPVVGADGDRTSELWAAVVDTAAD